MSTVKLSQDSRKVPVGTRKQNIQNRTYITIRIRKRNNKNTLKGKGKAVPFTGLEWPRVFQEVKVPRFHDNGTGWW